MKSLKHKARIWFYDNNLFMTLDEHCLCLYKKIDKYSIPLVKILEAGYANCYLDILMAKFRIGQKIEINSNIPR